MRAKTAKAIMEACSVRNELHLYREAKKNHNHVEQKPKLKLSKRQVRLKAAI